MDIGAITHVESPLKEDFPEKEREREREFAIKCSNGLSPFFIHPDCLCSDLSKYPSKKK